MKFIHLADLHIGKTVNGFSMLEDQRFIFEQIIKYVVEQAVDAIVIAGDVYDKTTPSAEAVQLYDSFITNLSHHKVPLIIISGNHDSPERLSFASKIMERSNIHTYSMFNGKLGVLTLQDSYGPVHFHLLPFVKPATVRHFYPDADINTYHDAVKTVLQDRVFDKEQRNVLVAHQFVVATGVTPELSDSEISPVGGIDSINAELFDSFDYVALGHLHGPQQVGRPHVRYSGSPLKYSFSETNHNKSATLVELKEKGNVEFTLLPLTPLRDMRKISGPLEQLTAPEIVSAVNTYDYLQVTLTNNHELIEPMAKLRSIYPNVMELHYDNSRTQAESDFDATVEIDNKSPMDLFVEFYYEQNGTEPTQEQQSIVLEAFETLEDTL